MAELPGIPEELQPDKQTPVEKLRDPKAPEVAVVPPHDFTSEPVEVIPEVEM